MVLLNSKQQMKQYNNADSLFEIHIAHKYVSLQFI